MPRTFPSASTRRPERSARSLASPPVRSIGICPTPLKNALLSSPLTPLPVKYSALARNTTFRGSGIGPKKWSANDRWLLTRMTGTPAGHVLAARATRAGISPSARRPACTWLPSRTQVHRRTSCGFCGGCRVAEWCCFFGFRTDRGFALAASWPRCCGRTGFRGTMRWCRHYRLTPSRSPPSRFGRRRAGRGPRPARLHRQHPDRPRLGRAPGRGRAHRPGAAAGRARRDLAGPGQDGLDRLVRRRLACLRLALAAVLAGVRGRHLDGRLPGAATGGDAGAAGVRRRSW